MPRRSSTLDRAKMLRESSSTRSTVRPTRSSSDELSRSSMRCFSAGRSAKTRCRNSAVSSSRRSGDSTPLTTMLRAMVCSCASSLADNSRPVNTTTGTSAKRRLAAHAVPAPRSPTCRAGAGRARRNRKAPRAGFERLGARRGGHDLDVVVAKEFADAQLLGGVVFDDQKTLPARLARIPDLLSAASMPSRRRRLGDKGERAARQSVLTVFVQRDDLHGDMAGQRILFELTEHVPAQHVGQEHVERYRGRLVLLARSSASSPRIANSTLKPLSRARSSRMRA